MEIIVWLRITTTWKIEWNSYSIRKAENYCFRRHLKGLKFSNNIVKMQRSELISCFTNPTRKCLFGVWNPQQCTIHGRVKTDHVALAALMEFTTWLSHVFYILFTSFKYYLIGQLQCLYFFKKGIVSGEFLKCGNCFVVILATSFAHATLITTLFFFEII